jgi:hypothetical protein
LSTAPCLSLRTSRSVDPDDAVRPPICQLGRGGKRRTAGVAKSVGAVCPLSGPLNGPEFRPFAVHRAQASMRFQQHHPGTTECARQDDGGCATAATLGPARRAAYGELHDERGAGPGGSSRRLLRPLFARSVRQMIRHDDGMPDTERANAAGSYGRACGTSAARTMEADDIGRGLAEDKADFGRLYLRCRDPVCRYTRRLSGSEDEAGRSDGTHVRTRAGGPSSSISGRTPRGRVCRGRTRRTGLRGMTTWIQWDSC